MRVFSSLALACTLWLVPSIAAGTGLLQTIPADGALADIEARAGVVFVDLYAEW